MLLALTATTALVALLLALIYAAGVHALPILAGLAAFAGLSAVAVPLGASILAATLVAIGAGSASRRAMTSTHRELRYMSCTAVAICAGYAGFAMAGEIAVFAGLGSVARIAIALGAGAALAAASVWRASPGEIGTVGH